MAKCDLCGKGRGRRRHISAGRLYQIRRGPLDVVVCDRCVEEQACPGQCLSGKIVVRESDRVVRSDCPVCGGRGTFDYPEV